MAGLNTRFHDVGVDCPKYLLPWGNESIITEILEQLTKDYNFKEIMLLANKRDSYFKHKLRLATDKFGVNIYYIGDTHGQAETAAIAAKMTELDCPILFHNADTIISDRSMKGIQEFLIRNDAYIDTFYADNPAYCYVNVDHEKIISIDEKKTITGIASSGLYGFKSAKEYLKAYDQTVKFASSETYISDVLQTILKNGGSIAINERIHSQSFFKNRAATKVIGSPKEYWEAINEIN
jgi:NDP-sugar pyrophosphorylase family protein